jgi:hypothetical protein
VSSSATVAVGDLAAVRVEAMAIIARGYGQEAETDKVSALVISLYKQAACNIRRARLESSRRCA